MRINGLVMHKAVQTGIEEDENEFKSVTHFITFLSLLLAS